MNFDPESFFSFIYICLLVSIPCVLYAVVYCDDIYKDKEDK